MFCPNCGTQPQGADQKFCKTCGTNLTAVSQVLRSSTPASTPSSTPYAPAPPPQPMPGMMPGPTGLPPAVNFPPNPAQMPISLSSLGSLPFMEEVAKRDKLRKFGWLMMGGGILLGILLGIIGDALAHIIGPLGRAIGELGGLGGLVFVAGFFLWFYARFILKKPDMPQFIVVQQPMPGMTAGLPQQPPVPAQQQLGPPRVPSFYQPPSVTENTTERLDAPYPMSSKDTQ